MKKDNDKNQIMNLYEMLIKNYYLKTQSIELTMNYLEKIKITNEDYEKIADKITNNRKYKVFTTESEKIIELLTKKLTDYTLEYNSNDIEPTIYFHLNNNTSYLINYDSIESKWYLSLIETLSSKLIKEIYNDTFDNFIIYLNSNTFN